LGLKNQKVMTYIIDFFSEISSKKNEKPENNDQDSNKKQKQLNKNLLNYILNKLEITAVDKDDQPKDILIKVLNLFENPNKKLNFNEFAQKIICLKLFIKLDDNHGKGDISIQKFRDYYSEENKDQFTHCNEFEFILSIIGSRFVTDNLNYWNFLGNVGRFEEHSQKNSI
jgi:hypothetical protein